ncbi:hypothetical protein O9992_17480 [Vibrio lentus]|nr:hypothetical protein [Vibrio lentus]
MYCRGPILEDNAPSKVIVPTVLNDTTLSIEGETIEERNQYTPSLSVGSILKIRLVAVV